MAEQIVVKSTLQKIECYRVPTLDYLLEVVGINSTRSFLTINKETFNTSRNNLSSDVYKDVATVSRVDCGLMTIQYLDCMTLSKKLIANRGVDPDVTLIGTLEKYSVLHFKRVMRHVFVNKASTDGVELKKLPNNMQQNTTSFKDWCTTIE